MVHTLPDYSTRYKMARVFANIDDAELAARLGSINTFDRRGTVFLMENFEAPISKWTGSATGIGSGTSITIERVKSGSQSWKGTTGDIIGDHIDLYNYFQRPANLTMGLEVSVTLHHQMDYYGLRISDWNGSTVTSAEIRYYVDTDTLKYRDSAGIYQDITTSLELYDLLDTWHTIKIVADFSKKEYMRCLVDENTYDLSGTACQETPVVHDPLAVGYIKAYTRVNANRTCYVDNIIVTQDEP